jgi:hypothetical protein
MQTMRDIMLPLAAGSGEDDVEVEEEEEEYEPPSIPAPTETTSEADSREVAPSQADSSMPDTEPDTDSESELQPETDAEEVALGEFEEFRQDELRDAVASALAASAEHDLKSMDLGRRDEAEEEKADAVDALPSSSTSSASHRAPSSTSALYNSSATLPPGRIPVVSSLTPSSETAAAAEHPHEYSAVDSSLTEEDEGADPMSYKVESLRLFLSEKLGDDLLLDIYRLLRRSMQHMGVQSVHTVYTSCESAHSSPNATAALQPNSSRVGVNGAPSSRRGSISSLVVNHINIRELLNGTSALRSTLDQRASLSLIRIAGSIELIGYLTTEFVIGSTSISPPLTMKFA